MIFGVWISFSPPAPGRDLYRSAVDVRRGSGSVHTEDDTARSTTVPAAVKNRDGKKSTDLSSASPLSFFQTERDEGHGQQREKMKKPGSRSGASTGVLPLRLELEISMPPRGTATLAHSNAADDTGGHDATTDHGSYTFDVEVLPPDAAESAALENKRREYSMAGSSTEAASQRPAHKKTTPRATLKPDVIANESDDPPARQHLVSSTSKAPAAERADTDANPGDGGAEQTATEPAPGLHAGNSAGDVVPAEEAQASFESGGELALVNDGATEANAEKLTGSTGGHAVGKPAARVAGSTGEHGAQDSSGTDAAGGAEARDAHAGAVGQVPAATAGRHRAQNGAETTTTHGEKPAGSDGSSVLDETPSSPPSPKPTLGWLGGSWVPSFMKKSASVPPSPSTTATASVGAETTTSSYHVSATGTLSYLIIVPQPLDAASSSSSSSYITPRSVGSGPSTDDDTSSSGKSSSPFSRGAETAESLKPRDRDLYMLKLYDRAGGKMQAGVSRVLKMPGKDASTGGADVSKAERFFCKHAIQFNSDEAKKYHQKRFESEFVLYKKYVSKVLWKRKETGAKALSVNEGKLAAPAVRCSKYGSDPLGSVGSTPNTIPLPRFGADSDTWPCDLFAVAEVHARRTRQQIPIKMNRGDIEVERVSFFSDAGGGESPPAVAADERTPITPRASSTGGARLSFENEGGNKEQLFAICQMSMDGDLYALISRFHAEATIAAHQKSGAAVGGGAMGSTTSATATQRDDLERAVAEEEERLKQIRGIIRLEFREIFTDLIDQTTRALFELHEICKVFHMDIKPANILWEEVYTTVKGAAGGSEYRFSFGDFGSSCMYQKVGGEDDEDASDCKSVGVLDGGTAEYMAPEHTDVRRTAAKMAEEGRGASGASMSLLRADFYSLSVALIEVMWKLCKPPGIDKSDEPASEGYQPGLQATGDRPVSAGLDNPIAFIGAIYQGKKLATSLPMRFQKHFLERLQKIDPELLKLLDAPECFFIFDEGWKARADEHWTKAETWDGAAVSTSDVDETDDNAKEA
ncbi:unnamed protein product, partial [Amoebophrya sp. A120]